MRMRAVMFLLVWGLGLPCAEYASASDAATVIFNSGQVVRVEDGYGQLAAAMKDLAGKDVSHKIVELDLGGRNVILNMAEVAVLCRDDCRAAAIRHELDPARVRKPAAGREMQ